MAIGKTPYRNHFMKPCNPVSIKPNDYKQSNIINQYMKDANYKSGNVAGIGNVTIIVIICQR